MNDYVALLRGINVGGKHKLPMTLLVELAQAIGARDVTTYIQSGNAMFRATAAVARRLPDDLAAAIAARLGFAVPVVVRSLDEIAALRSPYPIETSHVAFLADAPSKAAIATLDPARSPPDEFTVRGREIYVWAPNGLARTRLTNAYFDAKLSTTSTLRNWNTVLALRDRMRSR